MSLFNECKQELQHLLDEVSGLHRETFTLMEKVESVSTFGIEGLDIKGEWQGTDKRFKRLILRIKYKAEELSMFSDQRVFSERQAEEIRELWNTVLAKIQVTSSLIRDAIDTLKSNNFFVEIILWFEELWESVKVALRVAAKVIVQGAALMMGGSLEPIFLPPSNQ
ncbi:hypothetical protein H6G27_33635 [Nostoc linckia FACHB-104]|nr:hypothetical protein [Nostoc linckia FACHB-104]